MAETASVLTAPKYAKLVKEIRALLAQGKARAQEAVNQELVQTYWAIGKRLSQEHLTGRANYGSAILEDLSEELDVDERTLRHAIQFFEAYKLSPRAHNLTWAHFRELIRVKDPDAREFYEKEAERLDWTRDDLARAIQREAHQTEDKQQSRATLKRPTEPTYVYQAVVERVIDGDTILLRVDLGFAVWKEQRIRLAALDTPPMDQPGGQEAYRYVRDQLAQAQTVVVKTHKIDIYGRYVGHIFYTLKDADLADVFTGGRYLNQELLAKGLATTV